MKVLAVARVGKRTEIDLRELALTATLSVAALLLCPLTGCSLTHVEARPAPRAASVAIVGLESAFVIPLDVEARLRAELAVSLAAKGNIVVDPRDAACQVVALVDREFHSSRVTGGLRTQTDYQYGTYHVRLVVVDEMGKRVGEVRTERDEFLSTLKTHPEREEQLLVEGIHRAAEAIFVPSVPGKDLGVLRASR